jgi:internalin A
MKMPLAGRFLAPLGLVLAACDAPSSGGPSGPSSSAATSSAPPVASIPPPASASATGVPSKVHKPCSREATVAFDDPTLERVIRFQLKQPDGAVTRASLARVTTLNLKAVKLDDLDPCLFADLTGVKGLYLPPGPIRDLAPLKGLIHLERLGLASTAVNDLTIVAGFGKLDQLDLSKTPISDIAPLSALTGLTQLGLDGTAVADLGPVAKMTNMEELSIQNTPIASLEPLRGLTHLKKLYIAGSLVTDTSPVRATRGLKIFQQP